MPNPNNYYAGIKYTNQKNQYYGRKKFYNR